MSSSPSAGNRDDADTAGIPFPPPVAFLVALGAGFALQRFVPLHLARSTAGIDALELAGAVLVLAAAALAGWALFSFRSAGTSPFPERPSDSLVVRGPFRFTRNPLYLAMAVIHAGAALFANAPWPLLFLVPALLAIRFLVIAREERYLLRRFGSEYEAYCRSVSRWL